jgi:capsid protein
MRNPISNWLERRQAEHEAGMAELAARRAASKALEETTNMVTERPDTGGWARAGQLDQAHLPSDRANMIRQARTMWRFDPNARAVLGTMTYYIIGEGVKITPQSDDPRLHRLWREFWNAPRNRMQLRQAEIILRALRDGEVILEFFNKGTWKTTVRFRDPDLLRDPGLEFGGPNGRARDGILLDPSDNEKPLAYFFAHSYDDQAKIDRVEAANVLHIKLCVDSEQKRGESYIQPIMEMFGQYKEWLRYRIVLNKVRTAMVMIRKVTGSASDVEAIKGTLEQSPTARGGETKKRIPPPGTILNANGGVEYDFKSPNINAGDAAEDGRSMKLSMAAGSITPEYTFGDASNANYASTLIAESPFVKGTKFWQNFFEFYWKEIYRRVVQAAVTDGKLTAPDEDDIFAEAGAKEVAEAEKTPPAPKPGEPQGKAEDAPDDAGEEDKPEADPLHEMSDFEKFWNADVQWPEIVHRDMKETTDSVIAQKNAGLISDPTAAAILGHDYEEEVRKQQMVDETSADNPFKQQAAQPFGDEGDMDAEMQELVKGLTPDEAQKVMQATDPKAVAALLVEKRKKAQGG